MALVGSRRYVGYAAALCVTMAAMMGYANADDTKAVSGTNLFTKVLGGGNAPETKVETKTAGDLQPAAGEAESPKSPAMKTVLNPKTDARPEGKKAEKLTPAAGKKRSAKAKKAKKKLKDDAIDDDAAQAYGYDSDPLEPLNRAMFEFNRTVDGVLLRPVTSIYRGVVPEPGRTAVTNVLTNLYAPVTFANSLLQCDIQNTFATFWRFFLNTTVGIGGIFDVASEAGLKNRVTDMGQTFALHGADSGPYVVIPVIGPSNVRDALGRLGDVFLFPPNYADEWAVPLAIGAVTAVDARSNNMELIDGIYASSIDPYATFRSAYTQRRNESIRRAKESRAESIAQVKAGGKAAY